VLLEGKTGRRNELFAVDVETGKVLWRKPVREAIASPR
jgi:outer membrane protein assembly factor BamB